MTKHKLNPFNEVDFMPRLKHDKMGYLVIIVGLSDLNIQLTLSRE